MQTQELVEAFITSRRARRVSDKYVEWLNYTLGKLAVAAPIFPQTPDELEAAQLTLLKLSASTQIDCWRAWRMLYRWVAARRGLADAMADVVKPRPSKKLLPTFTEVEVEQLQFANRRYRRDLALVRFLLNTGMRIDECAGVRRRSFSGSAEDGYTVRVDGKGDRQRYVPVSPDVVGEVLALGRADEVWNNVTTNALQKACRRAFGRANLYGGPHKLRHTFGRLYILAGGDLVSLQRIMGHANIETTRRYVDLDIRDVQAQHAKFVPVGGRRQQQGHQLTMLRVVE